MALITIRRRTAAAGLAVPTAAAAAARVLGYSLFSLANAVAAQLVWRQFVAEPIRPDVAIGLYFDHEELLALVTIVSPVFLVLGLRFAPFVRRRIWVALWGLGAPWLLPSLGWILSIELLAIVWLAPMLWVWLGWWPLAAQHPAALHRARWATRQDLRALLSRPSRAHVEAPTREAGLPPAEALVLGTLGKEWVTVSSLPTHKELGGELVVGRPRSGKGLLGTTQLLGAWEGRSAAVTDLKGEAFAATAGYRSRMGKVFVLDPTGVGHRFDPLAVEDIHQARLPTESGWTDGCPAHEHAPSVSCGTTCPGEKTASNLVAGATL